MNAPVNKGMFLRRSTPTASRHPAHAASQPERRSEHRRQAAVACDIIICGWSYPGMIRNISSEGMTLKFESMPAISKGEQLLVKASIFEPITGVVRWVDAHECGMAFNFALAEDVLNDSAALFDLGKRMRPGRAKVQLLTTVRGEGLERKALIENIGSGGALLATGLSLSIGRRVTLKIADVEPIPSFVRWSRLGRCGVMFTSLLPVTAAERIAVQCSVHPSWLDEIKEAHATLGWRRIDDLGR